MDFDIPADQSEKKRRDNYLGHVRELRKLWNMRMVVKPILNSALGMVPKGLERKLEELEISG